MNVVGTKTKSDPKYVEMEERLAREMAKMRLDSDRRKVEVDRICSGSEEIKELQEKIRNAYLNKERLAQLAETQFKKVKEVEEDARIDMAMLRQKEIDDAVERQTQQIKAVERVENKQLIQSQMMDKEAMRLEAQRADYEREKNQVEAVVQKLIDEDTEMMRLTKMKQDQSKMDMKQSVLEKRRQEARIREIAKEEEDAVRRYAEEQSAREVAIRREKAKVEAEREKIFNRLKQEEELRRADEEYNERLRNELYQEEFEEREREKERQEAEKRYNVMQELLRAQEYQRMLKEEREAEEKRIEEEFKSKMLEKFAEDDRIEQLNAQRRRIKEQEHRREVERLWQERLALYREQREIELEEKRLKEEEEARQQDIVRLEMERLIAEHGDVLQKYHPKASTMYSDGFYKGTQ
jgi:hypothetical protein